MVMLFDFMNELIIQMAGVLLSQIVQKTFIGEGEGKKAPNFVAGEILSFFTRNNFVVTDRGETIT